LSGSIGRETPIGVPISPKEGLHVVTRRIAGPDLDRLVTRKCDLSTPADRVWLVTQVTKEGLSFKIDELRSTIDFLSGIMGKDWLTIYPGGMLSVRTGARKFQGFYLFEHLIPLGWGLRLLENKPGFAILLHKLNQPAFDRLSSMLEALSVARYAAAGYDVELEPRTPEGKNSDFRVLFHGEPIYFECKRLNVEDNKSAKKNFEFADQLMGVVTSKFKERIPNGYRIEIRLDRKPTSAELHALLDDLEKVIVNCRYELWVTKRFGKYALIPKDSERPRNGYPANVMQITVGSTPIPLSLAQATACIFLNPYGSKIEKKFRAALKQSRRQIPSRNRGILVIQGLSENKASEIMQERLGHPEYHNIIAGVAIHNGAVLVRRDDHADVDTDFIGKCVSHSLFYGYDVGNQ
jgi:hypothetical protein